MICDKIQTYLSENHISQHVISDALHIDERVCRKKLCGEIGITAEEYYTICKVLKVDLQFFAL